MDMKNLKYLISAKSDEGVVCMFHGFDLESKRVVIVYDTKGNVLEVDVT